MPTVTDCYSPDNDRIKPRLTKVEKFEELGEILERLGRELGKTQADHRIKTDLPGINIFIFNNAKLTRVQIFTRIKSNAKLTGGLKNFRTFKKLRLITVQKILTNQ